MVTIDAFHEDDAETVGRLIADTYGEYNLSFASPENRALLLGPFQHAYSPEKAHQEAIARLIRSEMVFVARYEGEIVGVLRGRKERLGSLFVRGDHHRQGWRAEVVIAAEEDLIGAVFLLASHYALWPVAGIAGVVAAILELPYTQMAAGPLKAPPHAVPGVEVGGEGGGANVYIAVVEGHVFHRNIIYRQCDGGGDFRI